MTCPECRWMGRAIRVYRPRPSKTKLLVCPNCFAEVEQYTPRPRKQKVRRYTGAVD